VNGIRVWPGSSVLRPRVAVVVNLLIQKRCGFTGSRPFSTSFGRFDLGTHLEDSCVLLLHQRSPIWRRHGMLLPSAVSAIAALPPWSRILALFVPWAAYALKVLSSLRQAARKLTQASGKAALLLSCVLLLPCCESVTLLDVQYLNRVVVLLLPCQTNRSAPEASCMFDSNTLDS
jgi:hypothetical protein